ncbi:DUF2625 domain-containing protein [Flagellimonas baculiformis]|uniref:DUF2625 domain-containing protein n=1 Tax=Flagellimonas baculiformis TaxID=3067310 RepID=UPI00296EE06F|nr:DUF2625 domain-containing protein [Muricauda sp. D6]
MKKSVLLILLFKGILYGQSNDLKSFEELINKKEPGWDIVKEWIDEATNPIEILEKDTIRAKNALLQTQVTTRSPMGAIVYETGGILVDNGWIRILGSGHLKLDRTLPEWNKGKTLENFGDYPTIYLIADDIVGGFFAINGGVLGEDIGSIYYFAPDTLEWEPMNMGYSEFIWWTFVGNLSDFYSNVRWKGWETDIKSLDGNKVISFFPYLWTKYDDINELSRKAVPIKEIWLLHQNLVKQLNNNN